jgi:methylornithine synthase
MASFPTLQRFAPIDDASGILEMKPPLAAIPRKRSEIALYDCLQRCLQGGIPEPEEVRYLLSLRAPEALDRLFSTARAIRRRHFGRKVFVYGFVYFSTHCRNDCHFCQFRQSHVDLRRYRKTTQEIVAAACRLAESGVHLIDLTMGEDPVFLKAHGEHLIALVKEVRAATGLPIMLSPGVLQEELLTRLAAAGMDWYACYQETHNPALFRRLRVGQSFEARLDIKLAAKNRSLLVEEGLLLGVGESVHDLADAFAAMRQMDADQVRVMTYVSHPYSNLRPPERKHDLKELICIAVLRLLFPDRLIPASLDVEGLVGLESRLAAGANVVTSIVPPGKGLAGVASPTLDIDDERRTTAALGPILKANGLEQAELSSYTNYINQRRSSGRVPCTAAAGTPSPITCRE